MMPSLPGCQVVPLGVASASGANASSAKTGTGRTNCAAANTAIAARMAFVCIGPHSTVAMRVSHPGSNQPSLAILTVGQAMLGRAVMPVVPISTNCPREECVNPGFRDSGHKPAIDGFHCCHQPSPSILTRADMPGRRPSERTRRPWRTICCHNGCQPAVRSIATTLKSRQHESQQAWRPLVGNCPAA